MKYFLELCSHAARSGITANEKRSLNEEEIGYLKASQPIVFFEGPTKTVGFPELNGNGEPVFAPSIDAPFKIFSIENFNNKPLELYESENGEINEILCIVVIEVEPKRFGFLTYARSQHSGYTRLLRSKEEAPIVEQYVNKLNRWQIGFENTRQTVKLGSGKNKETHRIRKIVYVCPKGEYEKQNEKLGKQIDWSHRWLVRGHWRKCEGSLGKDREGLHCIPNYTWVVDHVKGPEDKILIADKTRLVKNRGETYELRPC